MSDKILVLWESLQEAFGEVGGKYPQYYYAYAELKTSGIRFPKRQKDAALIYSPTMPTYCLQVRYGMPSNSVERLDEAIANGNLNLLDLKNTLSVMGLFINMLHAVNQKTSLPPKHTMRVAPRARMNQQAARRFSFFCISPHWK